MLEWRFDLLGDHALPEVEGYDQPVVVVCSEGYASSLAAASLRELGFTHAGDLTGGYLAWRRWRDGWTRPRTERSRPGNFRPAASYRPSRDAPQVILRCSTSPRVPAGWPQLEKVP